MTSALQLPSWTRAKPITPHTTIDSNYLNWLHIQLQINNLLAKWMSRGDTSIPSSRICTTMASLIALDFSSRAQDDSKNKS